MAFKSLLVSLLVLLALSATSIIEAEDSTHHENAGRKGCGLEKQPTVDTKNVTAGLCKYRIWVKTGSGLSSGTDSKVSLQLFDQFTNMVYIPNLENWGIMGSGYDYFEIGNLDIFEGFSNCLSGRVCMINLWHDKSGSGPDWYVDYVQAKSALNPQIQFFPVNRWLEGDTLNVLVNDCFIKKNQDEDIKQVTEV